MWWLSVTGNHGSHPLVGSLLIWYVFIYVYIYMGHKHLQETFKPLRAMTGLLSLILAAVP